MSDEEAKSGGEEEKPPQLPFFADYDKRGVAKCKVCKHRFEKGEFRIGRFGYNPFGPTPMKQYHHIDCLFDAFKKAKATTKKIDDVQEDVEGWGDIEEEDQQNVLIALEAYQKFCKDKGISSKTTPKADKTKKKTPAAGETHKKGVVKEEPERDDPAEQKLRAKDNSFREFRRLCATIADQSSYLAKTEEVRKFLTKGSGGDKFRGDLELWVRLLLPGVIKRVYNLQSKQLIKVFSQVFMTNQEEMLEDLENGDIAETVRIFFEESRHVQPSSKSGVTLPMVDAWLSKLEGMSKEEEQIAHLSTVAAQCTSNDLKMVVRLIKADLRINAGAKHILDGIHPDAYSAFQTTRNISAVLQQVQEKSMGEGASLQRSLSIKARVLTPVLPMLALACKSVEEAFKRCPNGMYAEIKYDGERVQLHKTGDEFKYFSRSLKPVMNHKVAHFADFIPDAFPHGHDLILDAEVLLVDTRTGEPLPFGTLGVHKKNEFESAKVCLFVFDCIHYNGENLMKKPLCERRAVLQQNMTEVQHRVHFSEMKEIHRPDDLRAMIARVLSEGLEGLVLKDIKSIYEPGKRHWLKVKKDYLADGSLADAADLVVLGAWYGTGKKGGMMSVFLMGCYDSLSRKWCTVTKVHTGHDDATLEALQHSLKMTKISGDYDRVPAWLNCSRTMTPDFVAADPKDSPVWEISGAEFTQNQIHSAEGISIRFPRVTKQRPDKDWQQATSLQELKELFKVSKEKDYNEILGVPSAAQDGETSGHRSDAGVVKREYINDSNVEEHESKKKIKLEMDNENSSSKQLKRPLQQSTDDDDDEPEHKKIKSEVSDGERESKSSERRSADDVSPRSSKQGAAEHKAKENGNKEDRSKEKHKNRVSENGVSSKRKDTEEDRETRDKGEHNDRKKEKDRKESKNPREDKRKRDDKERREDKDKREDKERRDDKNKREDREGRKDKTRREDKALDVAKVKV
ncbi:DNA ligase ATP-dependent [Trinorchestia longiramus]|nr:DNA ligase ATP-dependent [Trinorchestia longiramus]